MLKIVQFTDSKEEENKDKELDAAIAREGQHSKMMLEMAIDDLKRYGVNHRQTFEQILGKVKDAKKNFLKMCSDEKYAKKNFRTALRNEYGHLIPFVNFQQRFNRLEIEFQKLVQVKTAENAVDDAKRKIQNFFDEIESAWKSRSHYSEKIEKTEKMIDSVKSDASLMASSEIIGFIKLYEEKIRSFKALIANTLLEKDFDNRRRDALQKLDNAEHAFKSNASQGMEHYEKAVKVFESIKSDEQFSKGSTASLVADFSKFLLEFETKRHKFLQYSSSVIQKGTAQRMINQCNEKLSQSQNLMKFDESAALELFNSARSTFVELSSDIMLSKLDIVLEFLPKFSQELDKHFSDLQSKIASVELNAIQNAFDYKMHCFDSKLDSRSFSEAQAELGHARGQLDLLRFSKNVNSKELFGKLIQKFEESQKRFLEKYSEVSFAERTNKLRYITEVSSSSASSTTFNSEKAVSDLQKLKFELAELRASVQPGENHQWSSKSIADIESMCSEYFKKANELEKLIFSRIQEAMYKELSDKIQHYDTVASSQLESKNWASLPSTLENMNGAIQDLRNSQLSANSEYMGKVQDYTKAMLQNLIHYREKFALETLSSEVDGLISKAERYLHIAEISFSSGDESQAKENIDQAEAASSELASDVRFASIGKVNTFFDSFGKRVSALKASLAAYLKKIPEKKSRAFIDAQLHLAQNALENQSEKCMEHSKNIVAELELMRGTCESSSELELWMNQISKKVDEIKVKFYEKVLRNEFEEMKKTCNSHLSNAKTFLEKNDFPQVSRYLASAKDVSQSIANNQSFAGIAAMEEFLKVCSQSFHAIEVGFEERLAKQEFTLFSQKIDSHFHLVKHYESIEKYDDAWTEIQKAKNLISESKSIVKHNAQAYNGMQAELDRLTNNLGESLLKNEIGSYVKRIEAGLRTAEMLLETNATSGAMENYETAFADYQQLASNPKYVQLDSLTPIIENLKNRLSNCKAQYFRIVEGEQIQRLKNSIEQGILTSKNLLEQNQNSLDFAVHMTSSGSEFSNDSEVSKYIAKAEEDLNNLSSSYGVLDDVSKFCQRCEEQILSIKRSQKEFALKIQVKKNEKNISFLLEAAEKDYSRSSFVTSLRNLSKAISLMDETFLEIDGNFADLLALKSKFEASFEELSIKLSSGASFSEIQEAIVKGNGLLREAKNIGGRFVNCSSVISKESWTKGISALQSFIQTESRKSDQYILYFPAVKELASKLKEEEAKYLNHFKSDCAAEMDDVRQSLKSVQILYNRGVLDSAAEELGKSLSKFSSLNDPVLSLSTELKEFVKKEIEPLRSALKNFLKEKELNTGNDTELTLEGCLLKAALPEVELVLPTFSISMDTPSSLMNPLKTYNEAARDLRQHYRSLVSSIKAYVKKQCDNLDDIVADDLDTDDQFWRIVREQMAKAVIHFNETDHIGYALDKVKNFSLSALQKEQNNSSVAKEALTEYEKVLKAFETLLERIPKLKDILKESKSIATSFKNSEASFEVLAETSSYQTVLQGTAWYGKNASLNSTELMARPYPEHIFYVNFIDNSHKILERIVDLEKRFGFSYPKKAEYEKKISELKAIAIEKHAELCFYFAINTKARQFIEALSRFPKALAYLKEAAIYINDEKLLLVVDEVQKASSPTSDIEETWVSPLSMQIKPYEISSEFASDRNAGESETWSNEQKALSGKIVFAKKKIGPSGLNSSELSSDFQGNDEIFARAFWPVVLNRVPLGKCPKSGKLLYGPKSFEVEKSMKAFEAEKSLHFYVYASINGVPVNELVTFSPFKSIGADVVSAYTESPDYVGMNVDYWTSNQSFPFLVSAKTVEDWENPWDIAAQRLKALISRLNPGKHAIKLELRYRVYTKPSQNRGYNPSIDFPIFNTSMSASIASGEFTIDTSNSPVVLGRVFPLRSIGSLSNDAANAIDASIKQYFDALYYSGRNAASPWKCISVILLGGWDSYLYECIEEISHDKWIKKTVSRHRVFFYITCFRSSKEGWPCDSVSAHYIIAHAADTLPGTPPALPIVEAYSNRQVTEFEAELLPNTVILPK